MKFHSQALRLCIIFKPETKTLAADGTQFNHKGVKVMFEDGHFETSDQAIIDLIKDHKDFGSKIFSDEEATRQLRSESRGAEPSHFVQEFEGSRIVGSRVTIGSDDPARIEAQEAQRKAMMETAKLVAQEMLKEMIPTIKEQLRTEILAEQGSAATQPTKVPEPQAEYAVTAPTSVTDLKKKK